MRAEWIGGPVVAAALLTGGAHVAGCIDVDGPLVDVPAIDLPGICGSDSDLRVLFIQGIGSTSCENRDEPAADFAKHVEWLRDSLMRDVEEVDGDSFLYYTYTSGEISAARPPVCSAVPCPEKGCPNYNKHDACWSLDDEYSLGRERPGIIGQARRLARYIDEHVEDDAKLTIVAHSQGGVLAAYTVKMLDRQAWPEIHPGRVQAIVTLDSPLRGISKYVADALKFPAGCGADRREDSHRDMERGTQVIQDAGSGEKPATTKLYTIDADPGCIGKYIPFRLCPRIVDTVTKSEWQVAHLTAKADTHSDIWRGKFNGSEEPSPAKTYVQSFIACAVGQLDEKCADYAKQRRDEFVPGK